MSSYFKIIGAASLGLLALGLCACGLKVEQAPRKVLPPLGPALTPPPQLNSEEQLNEAFLTDSFLAPVASGQNACSYLDHLREATPGEDRFRLLSDSRVLVNGKPLSEKSDKANDWFSWLDIFKIFSKGQAKLSMEGRVDISASPLYQYALLKQKIPNKEEFLKMVSDELDKSPAGLPILKQIIEGMRNGLLDPYLERNKIIQSRIHEAFPGVFDVHFSRYSLQNSLPELLIRNGTPDLKKLEPRRDENFKSWSEKSENWTRLMGYYSRPLPLVRNHSWEGFSQELQEALPLAVKAWSSVDPVEQSCSSVILSRALAQLLMMMGQDRLPVTEKREGRDSILPSFGQLLDNERGTRLRVCRTPGAYLHHGVRGALSEKDLEDFDPDHDDYDLRAEPASLPDCQNGEAVPLHSEAYEAHVFPSGEKTASLTAWVKNLAGLTRFVVAFNPGAPWWETQNGTPVPERFPLAYFEDLQSIRNSQAVVPYQAHALSLAFLRMGAGHLLTKHLVFVDGSLHETKNLEEASGIRFSEEAREAGSGGKIRTRLENMVDGAEVAFLLDSNFKHLADWKEQVLESPVDERDDQVAALNQDPEIFVKGMFGSDDNLRTLTDKGPQSLRTHLEQLEYAASLLLARYAERDPDRSIHCREDLISDLDQGREALSGARCSPALEKRWKKLLGHAASLYRSPLLQDLAGENP